MYDEVIDLEKINNSEDWLKHIQVSIDFTGSILLFLNMEVNIIHQGDCIEVLNEKFEEQSIDLIFAGPPYNLSGNGLLWKNNKIGGDWFMIDENWDKMSQSEYVKFTSDWMNASNRALKNRGSIYVACSYHNIAEVMMNLKEVDYKINNLITWYKTNSIPNMTKRTFTHSTEFVVWATKGANWKFKTNAGFMGNAYSAGKREIEKRGWQGFTSDSKT